MKKTLQQIRAKMQTSQHQLQTVKDESRIFLAAIASNLEVVVSIIVIAAILIVSVRLIGEVGGLITDSDYYAAFNTFLGHAFNVIIGIEFIKMLAKHTPGSAIEVLLFTIAREMVVNRKTPVENLIGIVTIAIIFVIRKYLFVHSFGEHIPVVAETMAQPEKPAATDEHISED